LLRAHTIASLPSHRQLDAKQQRFFTLRPRQNAGDKVHIETVGQNEYYETIMYRDEAAALLKRVPEHVAVAVYDGTGKVTFFGADPDQWYFDYRAISFQAPSGRGHTMRAPNRSGRDFFPRTSRYLGVYRGEYGLIESSGVG
jgi:hypothetical protein